ncbi:MAG: DUF433 domain-containing protein [Leptolyngbya sp. SIO1E4]|nr:DUF433 domain-containing protein [Leptolyngbya sp. SIO1E4]
MAHTATDHKYIELDENGVAFIADSTMKVSELITAHLTDGWSPEELHFQYPHISLSKVYSALSYYWDYKESVEAEIQQRLERVETLRRSNPPSRIAQKLREHGAIE